MSRPSPLDPDPGEPLALQTHARAAPGAYADLPCFAIEYSSRGDRVPGQIVLPDLPGASAPHPVVLLAHGLTSSRNGDGMDAVAARWVREGAAVAAIDFALHGERTSPKTSERLFESAPAALANGFDDRASEILWQEFARQSVLDLRRLVDVLEAFDGVDAKRLVYVGFSLGGILGAALCGVDPRPRGAALAIAGAGAPGGPLDPTAHVGNIAPRPLLFVNASRDETIARPHTERLYEAAGEPKQIEWFDAGHRDLPGAAMKRIWSFARPLLGLAPER
jgi:dienelactone hydrolase